MAKCIVNTGNSAGLNVRQTKSTTSNRLGVIDNGVEVDIVRCDGTWATLLYGGVPAFVQHRYLNDNGKPTVNGEGLVIGVEAYCNTNNVNVRNTPNGSTVITQIDKARKVDITNKQVSNGYYWYHVGFGWVRGDFLTPAVNVPTSDSSETSSELGHLSFSIDTKIDVSKHGSGGSVNLRNVNGDQIGTIPNNSDVKVVRLSGEWLPIKYGTKTGIVQARFVKNSDEYNKSSPANPLPYQFTDQVDTQAASQKSYSYDPAKAVEYALAHSKTEATQTPPRPCSVSNSAFDEDGSNDCANFVHQCICAGGAPMFNGWAYSIDGIPSSWSTEEWGLTNKGRRKLLEKYWLHRVTDLNSIVPGDIIYSYYSDYESRGWLTPYNHVTIAVSNAYTKNGKLGCDICGHTAHQKNEFKELNMQNTYCYRISSTICGNGEERNVDMEDNIATPVNE